MFFDDDVVFLWGWNAFCLVVRNGVAVELRSWLMSPGVYVGYADGLDLGLRL